MRYTYKVEIDKKGTQRWYKPGTEELHNEHGPAIVHTDGTKYWYINGKQHNESGPAVIRADGTKIWYFHGRLHNTSGPALVFANGTIKWFVNGKRHNEHGPAIVYADGTKKWYLNGTQLTEEEWNARTSSCEGKKITIDGKTYTLVGAERVEIDADGTQFWYKFKTPKHTIHNEYGPTIVYSNGTKECYINGKLHNEYGPALVYADGTKRWYLYGKLHNEHGPAIVTAHGNEYWYIHGKEFTKENFNRITST